MTIHLIHGIHDGGASPVERLIPYLNAAGFEVRYPNYGYILGVETRIANPIVCGTLRPYIAPGDILVGHSNGCAIAYDLMRSGAPIAGAVLINGALEQDIARPYPVKWIDVYWNPGDTITEAAKIGAEIGITDPVWGQLGHAGYSGGDPAIANINCGATMDMLAVSGHSDFFTPGKLAAWGPFLTNRLRARGAKAA